MINENPIINRLNKIINNGVKDSDNKHPISAEIILEFINNQPKVNEWISVEDRLPEEHDTIFAKLKGTSEWNSAMFEKVSDDVNVTVEFKDGSRKTMTMHTTDRKWMTGFELTKKKVIAWMPLPSKYEGQGE